MEEKEREKDDITRINYIEMQIKTVKPQPSDFGVHFDVTTHVRLVPPF